MGSVTTAQAPLAAFRMACRDFAQAVLTRVTWRAATMALLLALTLDLLRWFRFAGYAPPNFIGSSLVITNLGALFVMLAAFIADEAVERGARGWLTYLTALLIAGVATGYGQWYVRLWLHLYTAVNKPGVPVAVQRTQIIFVIFDVIIFGGFAMVGYFNRRGAERIMRGVRSAELRRVQVERELTESRLATLRAQLDPGLLFADLAEVRAAYAGAVPDADRRMDELIHRLQTSVVEGAVGPAARSGTR